MWYHFKTKIGTFWICPEPHRPGLFRLNIDDVRLGDYTSPAAAANDACIQVTGWSERGLLESVKVPCDISEWTRGRPNL